MTTRKAPPRNGASDGNTPAPVRTEARPQSGVILASASVSLIFNQPGVYRYYIQDRPEERATTAVDRTPARPNRVVARP